MSRLVLRTGSLRCAGFRISSQALQQQRKFATSLERGNKMNAIGAGASQGEIDRIVAATPNLTPPKFESVADERRHLKERLALAFRVFSKFGYVTSVAGHVTVRDPERKDCFWVNPLGLHFGLMKASDLLLVNPEGKVIEGGKNRMLNTAAYAIHHAIHTARPDVNAAAHAHTVHGMAFATLGRKLDMTTQDSCQFYNDHGIYTDFGGVVLEEDESKRITEALGKYSAVILQNHGYITVGQSIESAVARFVQFDILCQVQLLADAAAASRGQKTVHVKDAEAEAVHKITGTEIAGWLNGKMYMDLVDQETQGSYKS